MSENISLNSADMRSLIAAILAAGVIAAKASNESNTTEEAYDIYKDLRKRIADGGVR